MTPRNFIVGCCLLFAFLSLVASFINVHTEACGGYAIASFIWMAIAIGVGTKADD